jgi:hypothetical protein
MLGGRCRAASPVWCTGLGILIREGGMGACGYMFSNCRVGSASAWLSVGEVRGRVFMCVSVGGIRERVMGAYGAKRGPLDHVSLPPFCIGGCVIQVGVYTFVC